ncbi:MAG: hypothetical protein ACYDC8_00845 [Gammaproteobacteria bacterium]
MRSIVCLWPVVISIGLGACSKSSEPPPEPPKLRPDQTIFKDQVRALDKAKSVEDTLQQDAQHTRDAIDQQEAPSH